MMTDGFGRKIEYLRVSLTDRCNLRCRYCMPEAGVPLLDHKDILSLEEIERFVGIMAGMGIKKVRLTGGEPLLRKNITGLVRKLRGISDIETVALTTNGVFLPQMLDALTEAGIDMINISLDTLSREGIKRITGTDALGDVLRAIDQAEKIGIPVKLNCVPVRELNGNDFYELAGLAKDHGICVRFIELMPIGCGKHFTGIPSDEILHALENRYGKARLLKEDESSPAVYYRFDGFQEKVGFISPMSHAFCKSCNRIRLTADGRLKLCLADVAFLDVKRLLREKKSDEKIRSAIEEVLRKKPEAHSFSGDKKMCFTETRHMNEIGG